jgi:hypothetical protein
LAVALNEPEKDFIIQLTTGMVTIAPEILPYEIGNALTAMVKRKQITPNEAMSALSIANKIPVRLAQVDIPQALKLALDFSMLMMPIFCIVQNHHRVPSLPWTIA